MNFSNATFFHTQGVPENRWSSIVKILLSYLSTKYLKNTYKGYTGYTRCIGYTFILKSGLLIMKHTGSLSKTPQRTELTATNTQELGAINAESLQPYPTD